MRVLAKLGQVTSQYNGALDLIPARRFEPLAEPRQPFLFLWVVCGKDKLLRLGIVEPPGFAVHHELLGTVEVDGLPALGVILIDGMPYEIRHLGVADGESGWIPLTELAIGLIGLEEEDDGPVRILGLLFTHGLGGGFWDSWNPA